MSRTIGKVIQYILFLSIGLLLLWYAYKDTDLNELSGSLMRANWWWIIASLILGYLSMVVRGVRWNILLEPLGYKAPVWTNIHSVVFGYCMNNIVPRSGELARCGLLYRAEKIPVDKLFGTVILERIVDLLILGLVILLAAYLHAEALSNLTAQVDGGKGKVLLYLFLGGCIALILFIAVLRAFRHIRFISRVTEFLKGMLNGVKSIVRLKQKALFVFYSLLIWFIWLLMSQFMMYALEETQMMDMADTLFFLVAGSFGMLIPSPGGIGAYHFAALKGFEALGYAGSIGLTFAAITWACKTLLELISGLVSFMIVTNKVKKRANEV